MPTPSPLPVTRRKRGHPNWTSGYALVPCPDAPSAFEKQVTLLGLTPDRYATSQELKSWCEQHRNRCYIPEWLLKAWNIKVNPDFSRTD